MRLLNFYINRIHYFVAFALETCLSAFVSLHIFYSPSNQYGDWCVSIICSFYLVFNTSFLLVDYRGARCHSPHAAVHERKRLDGLTGGLADRDGSRFELSAECRKLTCGCAARSVGRGTQSRYVLLIASSMLRVSLI